MKKEQINNNFGNDAPNNSAFETETPKSFEEHMTEIEEEKQKIDQALKIDAERAASEYKITEYDKSLLSSIENIESENDRELALIAFSLPFAGFKDMDRKRSFLNGIENLAIEYANRDNKDLKVKEYFQEKYDNNLYDFVNEPSRTRSIMELEDAEKYLATPQEKRHIDGEYMFHAYALEFSKRIFAKNKSE